jgi:hypothetical protein
VTVGVSDFLLGSSGVCACETKRKIPKSRVSVNPKPKPQIYDLGVSDCCCKGGFEG